MPTGGWLAVASIVVLMVLPTSAMASEEGLAELLLTVDRTGSATIELDLPVSSLDSEFLAGLIEASLPCAIHRSEEYARGYVEGACPGMLRRNRRVVSGQVDIGRLVEKLSAAGVSFLRVKVAHPAVGFTQSSLGERNRWAPDGRVEYLRTFAVPTGARDGSFDVAFGYRGQDLLWAAVVLGLALGLPAGVAVTLERRSRSRLGTGLDDVARHQRYLQGVRWATWAAWLIALLGLRFWAFLAFIIDPAFPTVRAMCMMICLLVPPATANAIAEVAFAPLSQRARGTTWTVHEITRQAIWRQATMVAPLTLLGTGLLRAEANGLSSAVPWFTTALIVRTETHRLLSSAHRFVLEALTVGDLRDRVFGLAAAARVTLDAVFLVSGGRSRHANAYASGGRMVMLTDYLIQNLRREEVDGIVAHELAHLRRRHPLLYTARWGVIWTALAAGGLLMAGLVRSPAPLIGVPIFAALAVAALQRRSEGAADLDGAAITGKPEALIRALLRVGELNSQPRQWQQTLISHPSTLLRIHAIAKAHGVSDARVDELLLVSAVDPDETYSIPPGCRPGQTVYSTANRQRASRRFAWLALAAMVLIPSLAAIVAHELDLQGVELWVAYGTGLLIGLAVLLAIDNYLPVAPYRAWRRQIEAQAVEAGVDSRQAGGIYVGFSPDDRPRVYDGNGDWDLGFLFMGSDRLCYWGERTQFAIRRQDVVDTTLGPGVVATWASERVYVTWRDSDDTQQTINFRPADARSMRAIRPLAGILASRIAEWSAGTVAGAMLPAALHDLPKPDRREVTSNPSRSTEPWLLSRAVAWAALLAMSATVALDLPFRSAGAPFGLGPGAFVVAAAMCLGLFQWIPVRVTRTQRYR